MYHNLHDLIAYGPYDMDHLVWSHIEPYHIMVHMKRPISFVETKSVLRSQLYPIADDKDSLYLKLNMAFEHIMYATYDMTHIYIQTKTMPDHRLIV